MGKKLNHEKNQRIVIPLSKSTPIFYLKIITFTTTEIFT